MTSVLTAQAARHSLDNKIPPPLATVLIGTAMWTTTLFEPAIRLGGSLRLASAGAVIALGITTLALGFLAFRRAQTTIDPVQIHRASALVTYGIFRFTRNPMYVGFTLLLIGWAVFLAVPLSLLGPVVFVLFTTRFQILPEERAMLEKFGDEYAQYRKKVRRWL